MFTQSCNFKGREKNHLLAEIGKWEKMKFKITSCDRDYVIKISKCYYVLNKYQKKITKMLTKDFTALWDLDNTVSNFLIAS